MKKQHIGSRKYWQTVVVVIGIVLGLMVTGTTAFAKNLNPGVLPPHSHAFGKTFGEWSAEWWRFVLSIPASENPLLDETGDKCGIGQSGRVWFLVGTWVGPIIRTCTIPSSKAIFLPIINVECSTVEGGDFYCSDEEECKDCAKEFADGIGIDTLDVTIDGENVQNLEDFRVQSSLFDFTMPEEDNILDLPGVTSGSSVSDGYWLMLQATTPRQPRHPL